MTQTKRDLIEVSEHSIKTAAEMMGGDINSFSRVTAKAKEFSDAGLTPIFLFDNNDGTIELTTRERLNKQLH